MATSKVQIANLALVHVGGSAITSLTDDTNEARAVNQVYDLVRDAVLSDHPWNFAIKRVIPSVDAGTPVYDFAYRFDLPTDYLRLVGIEDDPDYKISGQFIECDSNPIKIKYVGENDTPTEYDAMFVMAFALRLASTISERLTQSSALSKELMEVSLKAREKKLSPEDLKGSTFTISSLGGIGGSSFSPIINPPEVAILGVSKSEWRPIYDSEKKNLIPRYILPLSLSYDHRVVDGALGATFTKRLTEVLKDPNPLSK